MNDILSVNLINRAVWAKEAPTAPGAFHDGRRIGVIWHHPFPHYALAGAGYSIELREVLAIDRYHRSIGWGGAGYHYVIAQSGRIFVTRGAQRTGAHSPGYNTTWFGIAFLIDGRTGVPSAAAIESAQSLLKHLVDTRMLSAAPMYQMHSDVRQTSCPGSEAERFLRAYDWKIGVSDVPRIPARRRVLSQGMRGEDVRQLQKMLRMDEKHQTGYFGPITNEAVRKFQTIHEITVDGVVGPQTWGRLHA